MKAVPDRDPAALRRAAEARLKASPKTGLPQTEADLRRLQHELEVHQIELEMQNQELRESELNLVAALERYADHFDFAPVGYFNLSADGKIMQVNLTGAKLIGIERDRLLGRAFELVLTEADRRPFNEFLASLFRSGDKGTCEIMLLRPGQPPRTGLLEATLAPDGKECRLVLVDITERKTREEDILRQADELKQRNATLEQMQQMFVGHELRMCELKDEVNKLKQRLQEAPAYPSLVPGFGTDIPPPQDPKPSP